MPLTSRRTATATATAAASLAVADISLAASGQPAAASWTVGLGTLLTLAAKIAADMIEQKKTTAASAELRAELRAELHAMTAERDYWRSRVVAQLDRLDRHDPPPR